MSLSPILLRRLVGLAALAVATGQFAGLSTAAVVAPRPLAPAQPADDEVTPFEPRQPRSERQQDRLHGMMLYAAARMADRASNYPQAMALYARAYRYHPENIDSLTRAMLLARVLGRHTISARYASQLVLRAPAEPLDLLRGLLYLRQEGRAADALRAYEKAIAGQEKTSPGPAWIELHKQAGQLYLQDKQYRQAADAFARVDAALQKPAAHGLDPETMKLIQGDADALYADIFEAYFKAGRYEPASEVLARLTKLSDDEGQALYAAARLAAAQKKYDDALRSLDAYLAKRFTTQAEAPYQLLREVLASQNRSAQLKTRLERALALDSANQPLAFFLAAQYVNDGKTAEARALYEKTLSRKPSTAGYQGLVGVLRRGGLAGPLLTTLGSAVASTGGLSVLGEEAAALSQDKPLQAALIAEAEKRLQQRPSELKPGQQLALALLCANAKQFDAAAKFFELAIQAEPDQKGSILSTWGLTLIAGEQYAAAVDVLQRALDERALPADNPALNYYLAGALAMVGRNDAALVAARKAAVPDASPELTSRVGWVQYHARQYDDARKSYAELIQRLDGVYDVAGVRDVVREARQTLSHINSLLGDNEQAEELLEQVLDEAPDNVGVRNDLGYLWADQGKHLERAHKMIREAVAAEPDNAAYRDSLGWILFRLGRYDEAIAELKLAAAGEKVDGVVLDHLGDALQQAGQTDEAVSTWKRAVDKFAPDEEAPRRATQKKIDRAASPPDLQMK